jgi:phosphatidylinositol glycan class Q protein
MWLDNWPAGLKLNTELSSFYCHTFIGFVYLWARTCSPRMVTSAYAHDSAGVLRFLQPYLPAAIYFIGLSGWSGVTMILSLSSDLLGLFTVHLYVSYLCATAVFANILRTAGSLWNLFRGAITRGCAVVVAHAVRREAVQRAPRPRRLVGL